MSTFDVVLTGWETWGQWHRMVKLKAMCCGFQQYIDIDSKNPPPLPTPPEKVDEYIATGLDDRPLSIQIYKYELAKKEYDEYRRKSEEMLEFICKRVEPTMHYSSLPALWCRIEKKKESVSPRSLLRELKVEYGRRKGR